MRYGGRPRAIFDVREAIATTVTIKASALLSIVVIWAAMIPAVVIEPDAWWTLIFAFLATGAVGVTAWRRMGFSRLVGVAGIWAGTAIAVTSGAGWVAVFAFLATGATVHSIMRRDAVLNGLGIAAAWLATGAVSAASDGDGAWVCVFAFLTAATIANHRSQGRGLAAALLWAAAGAIMVATEGWYWLAVIAWLVSTVLFGMTGFSIPRRLEWDLFERD